MSSLEARGFGAGLALTAVVLAGCSGENRPPEASETTSAAESATLAPDAELSAGQVEEGPVGALRDIGISAANGLSGVSDVSKEAVTALGAAAEIPHPGVSALTSTLINWTIAENTRYVASNIYSFNDSREAQEHNAELLAAAEQLIGYITDPAIQEAAENNLDYVEATAALQAATAPVPMPNITAQLLETVENPSILALASSAAGGNGTDATELATRAGQSDSGLESARLNAWGELFNGSNAQAKSINESIAAFNAARAATGD